tara:strand:- start:100 stop:615 length:516 start_codon:yes stop_codon:yes gene_type:complete
MCRNAPPWFTEKQRFRQWWVWLLVLWGPGFFIWAILQQVIMGAPIGNNPTSDLVLILLAVIFGAGLPGFIFVCGLDTEVNQHGVRIRFRPFHRRWVVFNFESIQTAEAITYSPLKDYGGWGIKYGRKGKAYNVSGNTGVLLTMKNGKCVLIGSMDHEALGRRIQQGLVKHP